MSGTYMYVKFCYMYVTICKKAENEVLNCKQTLSARHCCFVFNFCSIKHEPLEYQGLTKSNQSQRTMGNKKYLYERMMPNSELSTLDKLSHFRENNSKIENLAHSGEFRWCR